MDYSREDHAYPGSLAPDERRREVAALLARGILRLQSLASLDSAVVSEAADASESGQRGLEMSAPIRPHGTGG